MRARPIDHIAKLAAEASRNAERRLREATHKLIDQVTDLEVLTRCESDGDAIACPHCGAPNGDLWDHDFRRSEDIEIECGTCAAPVLLSRHVSITYTARALRAPAAVYGQPDGMVPPGGR